MYPIVPLRPEAVRRKSNGVGCDSRGGKKDASCAVVENAVAV